MVVPGYCADCKDTGRINHGIQLTATQIVILTAKRHFVYSYNVDETLSITDRAYLLFEGKILFKGTPQELADNPVVREKYLGRDFELKKKTKVEI